MLHLFFYMWTVFHSCLFLCLCCRNAGLQFFLRNTPLWPFTPALPIPSARAPLSSFCGSLARWGFKHSQCIFNAYTHYGALETRGQQVLNAQQFRSTSFIYSSCSFRSRSVCLLVRNGNRCTEQWFGWVPDGTHPPMLLGSCPVFTSAS